MKLKNKKVIMQVVKDPSTQAMLKTNWNSEKIVEVMDNIILFLDEEIVPIDVEDYQKYFSNQNFGKEKLKCTLCNSSVPSYEEYIEVKDPVGYSHSNLGICDVCSTVLEQEKNRLEDFKDLELHVKELYKKGILPDDWEEFVLPPNNVRGGYEESYPAETSRCIVCTRDLLEMSLVGGFFYPPQGESSYYKSELAICKYCISLIDKEIHFPQFENNSKYKNTVCAECDLVYYVIKDELQLRMGDSVSGQLMCGSCAEDHDLVGEKVRLTYKCTSCGNVSAHYISKELIKHHSYGSITISDLVRSLIEKCNFCTPKEDGYEEAKKDFDVFSFDTNFEGSGHSIQIIGQKTSPFTWSWIYWKDGITVVESGEPLRDMKTCIEDAFQTVHDNFGFLEICAYGEENS